VPQHEARFIAHTEASAGAELPRFIRDEFDAFLECGILAHGFLRLRCGECGQGVSFFRPVAGIPLAKALTSSNQPGKPAAGLRGPLMINWPGAVRDAARKAGVELP
jgi:hypothetical protein